VLLRGGVSSSFSGSLAFGRGDHAGRPGSGQRWPRPPPFRRERGTSGLTPLGITSNWQLFTFEVMPPGWVLPPARG